MQSNNFTPSEERASLLSSDSEMRNRHSQSSMSSSRHRDKGVCHTNIKRAELGNRLDELKDEYKWLCKNFLSSKEKKEYTSSFDEDKSWFRFVIWNWNDANRVETTDAEACGKYSKNLWGNLCKLRDLYRQKHMSELKNKLDASQTQVSQLTTELTTVRTALTENRAQVERLTRDLTSSQAEVTDLRNLCAVLRLESDARDNELDASQTQVSQLTTELTTARTALTETRAEVERLTRDLTSSRAEVTNLRNLCDVLRLESAARDGDVSEQIRLADHYSREGDTERARLWWSRAAIKGNPTAYDNLKRSLCSGENVFSIISNKLDLNSITVKKVHLRGRQDRASLLQGVRSNPDVQIAALMSGGYSREEALRIMVRIVSGASIGNSSDSD